jgi:hypothetical protein
VCELANFLDSDTILNEEGGPPSPEYGPVPKTNSQREAYRSTLTLVGDPTTANHPKVVASMTLGICTSEIVWIRLRSGMEDCPRQCPISPISLSTRTTATYEKTATDSWPQSELQAGNERNLQGSRDPSQLWCGAVARLLCGVAVGVDRSRMTGCRLVTPQPELRRPLRNTVPSNFFNVAREYAADSRS